MSMKNINPNKTSKGRDKYELTANGVVIDVYYGSVQVAKKAMRPLRNCVLYKYNPDGSKFAISQKVGKIRDPEVWHVRSTLLNGIQKVGSEA